MVVASYNINKFDSLSFYKFLTISEGQKQKVIFVLIIDHGFKNNRIIKILVDGRSHRNILM